MENQKIILTGYAKIYFSYYQNNSVVIKESKKRNLINYEHSIYQIINNKCLNIPTCYGMMSNNKFSYLILQNTGLSIDKIDKWLIYDIYKLLPVVSQNEEFKNLIKDVRSIRAMTNICPSAQPEVNVPELLSFLIENEVYRDDYEKVTARILEEDVNYETAIKAVKEIALSGLFE